jgi:hypothetical protein
MNRFTKNILGEVLSEQVEYFRELKSEEPPSFGKRNYSEMETYDDEEESYLARHRVMLDA